MSRYKRASHGEMDSEYYAYIRCCRGERDVHNTLFLHITTQLLNLRVTLLPPLRSNLKRTSAS